MAEKPTVAFDQFTDEYARNWKEQLTAIQSGSRIAWTESHEGFWVLTDYEAVARVGSDYKAFSSDNDIEDKRLKSRGILIPRNPFQLTLNEEDPPQSTKYRMLEAPFFTPKYLPRWAEVARHHTNAAIDAFIETGACDLVHDLAMPVPAKTTLQIVGVDVADWAAFALPAHTIAFTPSSSPEYPLEALLDIQARLGDLLDRRRDDPCDDAASRLAHATVDGAPLPRNIAVVMLSTLVTGGFDTTTALMCHALAWLADQPDAARRLLEDAKLMDNAVEEFLRVYPPTHGTARNVVEDVELCGQHLRAGERILMSYPAANHDPKKFECPYEVRIDRPNARDHLSFGSGPHRCLGAPLAKLETKIVIDAVLRRMPDYRLDQAGTRPYPTAGMIDGFLSMPVAFTPAAVFSIEPAASHRRGGHTESAIVHEVSREEVVQRLAIQDLLVAYGRGVDRVDIDLLKSCYWPEATDDHGTFVGNGHAFCDYLRTSLTRFISTTHVLSNMHVELEGDSARSECYFTATHWFPPDGAPIKVVLAGRYVDRLERRAGDWRILSRVAVADWVELGPGAEAFAPIFDKIVHRGARYPDDPWYAHAPGAAATLAGVV